MHRLTRMGKGYGLRLAIARKAVILQGGTIQARNLSTGGADHDAASA